MKGGLAGSRNSKLQIKNEVNRAYKCVDQKGDGRTPECSIVRNSEKEMKC